MHQHQERGGDALETRSLEGGSRVSERERTFESSKAGRDPRGATAVDGEKDREWQFELEQPHYAEEDRASWLSRLLFWWVNPLLRLGSKRALQVLFL